MDGTEFVRYVPCDLLYSNRNINKLIDTNNIFGIDLSSLNSIVPLTQYKKILYILGVESENKLDEVYSGKMTYRDLLSEGNMPTLNDILYNLFVCISGKNSQHWC